MVWPDLSGGSSMSDQSLLLALRRALADEGLFVVRVVTQRALDAAGVACRLDELRSGARSGLLVGDGGFTFFERFRGTPPGDGDGPGRGEGPLDHYTAQVVPAAVARAVTDGAFTARYPFSRDPPLPMQKLGEAAGLPPPGPLGVQVHPRFGPWWAYRALILLDAALDEEPPLAALCAGCPAPCVEACPGRAARPGGLDVGACVSQRLVSEPCQASCAARITCIAGPEHRYPDDQLAFHMGHSLRMIRRFAGSSAADDRLDR